MVVAGGSFLDDVSHAAMFRRTCSPTIPAHGRIEIEHTPSEGAPTTCRWTCPLVSGSSPCCSMAAPSPLALPATPPCRPCTRLVGICVRLLRSSASLGRAGNDTPHATVRSTIVCNVDALPRSLNGIHVPMLVVCTSEHGARTAHGISIAMVFDRCPLLHP